MLGVFLMVGRRIENVSDNLRLPRHGVIESWFENHSNLSALVVLVLAFAVRLRAAWGTFLNPDEALHFQLANKNSWAEAYRASLTSAHPPGLIFLLHFWRSFGTSEVTLRLPSVIAGAAFCWIGFKWLTKLLGSASAWIGFILLAFLPPLIELSAEVRQYALLLFFIVGAAYFLERALDENSPSWMLLSTGFIYLAMFSHYSAFLFAAAMGTYSLLRLVTGHFSKQIVAAWAAGQVGALALFAFLYKTHLSKLHGNNGQGTYLFAANSFLHNSYFYPGRENPLHFAFANTGGVFQYLFGQLAIGDVAFLLFLGAIVLLLRPGNKTSAESFVPWQLALLLALPFILNCAAALAGRYPYGGNRHCVFLAMFAVAAISYLLAMAVHQRTPRGVVLAFALVVACNLFGKPRAPFILRADQRKMHMAQALGAIEQQIPSSEPIFADYESSLLLGHYLCQQKPVSFDDSPYGFQKFRCGGHTVIAVHPEPMIFTAENFPARWEQLATSWHLSSGERIWVVQAGWDVGLASQLSKSRDFQLFQLESFGNNIAIFALRYP
jgi:hypothetical protein